MTELVSNVDSQPDGQSLVSLDADGKVRANSRDVAERFGKEHKNVLQAIDNLECSDEFRVLNFQHTPYVHPQNGQTYQMCEMTKNGFAFLVLGFTGSEAAIWKEKYIAAFDAMEEALKQKLTTPDLSDPAHLRSLLLDYSEKTLALQGKLDEAQPKVAALARIADADGTMHITAAAKHLQVRPKDLFAWLQANKWIYRRAGSGSYLGYQDKIQQGLLFHKVHEQHLEDGTTRIRERVHVLPKGLVRLAQRMGTEQKVDGEQTANC